MVFLFYLPVEFLNARPSSEVAIICTSVLFSCIKHKKQTPAFTKMTVMPVEGSRHCRRCAAHSLCNEPGLGGHLHLRMELKLVKESLCWFEQRRPCMSAIPFALLGLFTRC